ncbi:MAG TPA: dihydrofolate reductase [Verrucomicrobiae bacterium]|nr:dihydrofolate reductase [Verrucomicrobiae bacterium]
MKVSLIVAMAENRVIGRRGKLPWHIPEDLALFRRLTWGHTLIMGRKTFQSIGNALPGRKTVVLTRDSGFRAEGCEVEHDLRRALEREEEEVFVCGGGEIFRQALPLADRIYLTLVHAEVEGDTFFPEMPPDFRESAREELPSQPPCTFIVLDRKPTPPG